MQHTIPQEHGPRYLSTFFAQQPINGFIPAHKAQAYFKSFDIPSPVLSVIWNLADIDRDDKLSAPEFAIAMYLIELELAGQESPAILPPSFSASAVALIFSTLSVFGNEWAISESDRTKFKLHFNKLDPKRTGTVTKDMFLKSGLPINVSTSIWQLSDINGDGNLSEDEFSVAMYLVGLVKAEKPLPTFLPLNIIPPNYRQQLMANSSHISAKPQASTLSTSPSSHSPDYLSKLHSAGLLSMLTKKTASNFLQDSLSSPAKEISQIGSTNYLKPVAAPNNVYKSQLNSTKSEESMSDKKIWEYARDGDLEGVKKRVSLKGKQIINTEKENTGYTALIWASLRGHLPITQYLIDSGAHINDKDDDGNNALMFTVWQGQYSVVKYLINCGANINEKNSYGNTAFHRACNSLAAESTAIEIIKTLVANGADETIRNESNLIPSDYANNNILRNAATQAIQDKYNGMLQSYVLKCSISGVALSSSSSPFDFSNTQPLSHFEQLRQMLSVPQETTSFNKTKEHLHLFEDIKQGVTQLEQEMDTLHTSILNTSGLHFASSYPDLIPNSWSLLDSPSSPDFISNSSSENGVNKKDFKAKHLRQSYATSKYTRDRGHNDYYKKDGICYKQDVEISQEEYDRNAPNGAHKISLGLAAYLLNHTPGPIPSKEYMDNFIRVFNSPANIRSKTTFGNQIVDKKAETAQLNILEGKEVKISNIRDFERKIQQNENALLKIQNDPWMQAHPGHIKRLQEYQEKFKTYINQYKSTSTTSTTPLTPSKEHKANNCSALLAPPPSQIQEHQKKSPSSKAQDNQDDNKQTSNFWNDFQHKHAGKGLSKSEMSHLYHESSRLDRNNKYDNDDNNSRSSNSWNNFQHENAGKGLSRSEMSRLYHETLNDKYDKFDVNDKCNDDNDDSSSSSRSSNPWNDFQHENAGKGLSRSEMSDLYHETRNLDSYDSDYDKYGDNDYEDDSDGRSSNPWNDFQHDHAGMGLSRSEMSDLYHSSKK